MLSLLGVAVTLNFCRECQALICSCSADPAAGQDWDVHGSAGERLLAGQGRASWIVPGAGLRGEGRVLQNLGVLLN